VSGNFDVASRLWIAGSSAGGVNGIKLVVADIVASSGSSRKARLSFLGGFCLEKRTDGGELAREDRREVRRDSGLFR
jgi:hypothetical protein